MPMLRFSTLLLAFALASACPGSLSPGSHCKCRTGSEGDERGLHFVTCSKFNNDVDLSNELAQFKRVKIQKLILKDVVLNFLPHDLFQGLSVKFLEFHNSTLVCLSDTDLAFEGLEASLLGVTFIHCAMTNSWDWASLRNLRALTALHVLESDLVSVDDSWRQLGHLKHLSIVAFTRNQVSSIDDRAFADFVELRLLGLKGNPISELKRSMFPDPAEELRYLVLSLNEISVLPDDLFMNMPLLEVLDLRDNRLLTLKEETMAPVWGQLDVFETAGNPLSCDCRLKWVLGRSRIRQMSFSCHSPLRLKGKQVVDLRPEDLWC